MSNLIQSIIVDDEPIAREILNSHLSKIPNIEVIALCKNALEAFGAISEQPVDLIFLDINMPEISGLSFARSINKEVKIIFTTAYREYAVDGFDLKAVDYLLKPISFERLLQAIDKYRCENGVIAIEEEPAFRQEKQNYIFVRSDRKMIRINFSDILYIESISDYIKIHMNQQAVTTRETISNIEGKLPKNEFLRVHRSFIVAINSISSFTNELVEVGRKSIPISRSYKAEVLKCLENNN